MISLASLYLVETVKRFNLQLFTYISLLGNVRDECVVFDVTNTVCM